MPRQPRIEIPGALYHVMVRGIERRKIFKDDKDKRIFLGRFADLIEETRVVCYAWSLLWNHIHLLLSPREIPLHAFMHRLSTGYAVNFNSRHSRSGHLFQNRYRAILCQEEAYFQQLVRYIHLNPLLAGLVKTLAELDRYPWCGHSALMGYHPRTWQAVYETLRHFGDHPGRARAAYREYLRQKGCEDDETRFLGGGLVRSAGGRDMVKEMGETGARWDHDARVLGNGEFVAGILRDLEVKEARPSRLHKEGWDFEKVIEYVSQNTGVEIERIRQRCRGNEGSKARALVAYLCHYELDMSVTEIGACFGIRQPAASKMIRKVNKIRHILSIP